MPVTIKTKRVYDPPAPGDGLRILVDRMWPRGLSKDAASLDHWVKDVAPSSALRQWFGHKPERWDGFRARYNKELADNPALTDLRALLKQGKATLLYGAHDTEHNNAVALSAYLGGKRTSRKRTARTAR